MPDFNTVGRLSDDPGFRNFRDGEIIIRDGSAVPKELTLLGAEGDFTFTETANTFNILIRGKIISRTQGDEEQVSLSVTIKFEQWSHESGSNQGISPRDAFKGVGGASDWVSTAPCGPFSVDLIYKAKDVCGTGGKEVLLFPQVHADTITFNEGDETNTLAFEGTSLVPVPERSWEA